MKRKTRQAQNRGTCIVATASLIRSFVRFTDWLLRLNTWENGVSLKVQTVNRQANGQTDKQTWIGGM